MTDLRTADRRARRRAQEEFRRPLILEAGAGTGKTTTLVARVLVWCLGEGWSRHSIDLAEAAVASGRPASSLSPGTVAGRVLGRVVAITFTEAAAAEMASRIAEELAHIAAGTCPVWLAEDALPEETERRDRAKALAGALDHLTVRTIHAYCRSLLADHPLEGGLHPQFEVDASGLRVEKVCAEVVELALRRAYGEPGDEAFLILAARGMGPQSLASALQEMILEGVTPAMLGPDPLAPARVQSLLETLAERLEEALEAASPLAGVSKRSRLTLEVVEALGRTFETLRSVPFDAAALDRLQGEVASHWPENLLVRLRDWSRGKLNKAEADLLESTRALEGAAAGVSGSLQHLLRMDPELLQAARKALLPLLEEATETLRRQGVMTFSALLVEARKLLAEHPGVAARLRRQLDQLLVDEFQDTDRIQCDLIRRLSLEGPEEERPGLFLVGDPKQSIYGWRSADLVAYDEFLDEVRQKGGEVHGLSENFRSVPSILEEVQRSVEPVMEEERGLQPSFQPLLASAQRSEDPGFVDGGRRPLEAWVSWGPEGSQTRSTDAAHLEAEAVARDLLELHEAGVAFKDVGILLRSSGELDVYLEALRSAGVPFSVGRDKQYYQRREIIEAAALVRTVLDPGDQLALLTVLRSVLVGVPDAALLPLWAAGLPQKMIDLDLSGIREIAGQVASSLPANIPGLERILGWEDNLIEAASKLKILRQVFREESAAEFVSLLRRLFLQEVLESARYLGRYRVANLERFYRQLGEGLESGGDVNGLLRFLRRSVTEATAAEEGRLLDSSHDAVQVMTIHAAKGLGFEHVYLLQTHKKDPPPSRPSLAFGSVEGRDEYCLFGAPTPGFGRYLEAVRDREAAERVRLLYVALTRAKRRLVIVGKWPEANRPRGGAAQSMLDLLAHRQPPVGSVGELLEQALADFGAAGPGGEELLAKRVHVDHSELRWVFPGALPQPAPALSAEAAQESATVGGSPPGGLVSLGSGIRDAERLRELRRSAEARMARPFGGTPSGSREEGFPPEGTPEEPEELLLEPLRTGRAGDTPDLAAPRRIAMAAGSAVHRLLENLDLTAERELEIQEHLERLEEYLPPGMHPQDRKPALSEARRILSLAEQGSQLRRLFELGEAVVSKELPVLLPPREEDGPLGFISGVIDLLYKDPESGLLVVADFKTDALGSAADARERSRGYMKQGQTYQDAVQGAFGLDYRPRFELWFLTVDQVVEL